MDIFLKKHTGLTGEAFDEIDFEDPDKRLLTPLNQFLEQLASTSLQTEQLIFDGQMLKDFIKEHCSLLVAYQQALQRWLPQRKHCTQTSLLQLVRPLQKSGFMKFVRNSNTRTFSGYFIHLTFQEYFAARDWVQQYLAETTSDTELLKFLNRRGGHTRYEMFWVFVVGLLKKHSETHSDTKNKLKNYLRTLTTPFVQQDISLHTLVNNPKLVHRLLLTVRCYEEIQVPLTDTLKQLLFHFLDEICIYHTLDKPHSHLHKTLHYLRQCSYQKTKLNLERYFKAKEQRCRADAENGFPIFNQYAEQAALVLRLLTSEEDIDSTLQFTVINKNLPEEQCIEAVRQWVRLAEVSSVKQPYVDVLLETLTHDRAAVSHACLEGLATLGYVDADESLLNQLAHYHINTKHEATQILTANVMAQLKKIVPFYKYLKKLDSCVDEPNKTVELIRQLQSFKRWHTDLANTLFDKTSSPFPEVACEALKTLEVLLIAHPDAKSPQAQAALLKSAGDEFPEVRAAAHRALIALGYSSQDLKTTAYQTLISNEDDVWRAALELICNRRWHHSTQVNPALVPILIPLLSAANTHQILKGLHILSMLPHFDGQYVSLIQELLDTTSSEIRGFVIELALKFSQNDDNNSWFVALKHKTLLTALLHELLEGSTNARTSAAKVLGQLTFKQDAVKQALLKALTTDNVSIVRKQAAQSLIKLDLKRYDYPTDTTKKS